MCGPLRRFIKINKRRLTPCQESFVYSFIYEQVFHSNTTLGVRSTSQSQRRYIWKKWWRNVFRPQIWRCVIKTSSSFVRSTQSRSSSRNEPSLFSSVTSAPYIHFVRTDHLSRTSGVINASPPTWQLSLAPVPLTGRRVTKQACAALLFSGVTAVSGWWMIQVLEAEKMSRQHCVLYDLMYSRHVRTLATHHTCLAKNPANPANCSALLDTPRQTEVPCV